MSDPIPRPPSENETLSRHDQYYLPGGDLHFLFRRTHFRVHSYFFRRESNYWRKRMAGPVSPGDDLQQPGTHESTAFVVDEDPNAFATFLWVFYNPRYSIYLATLEQWTTILRLASLWDCPGIREFAVSFIDNIPMKIVEKIKIYQDYKVPRKYLLPLYAELATRDQMLERQEFRILDADTLYSIVRAREMLRAPSPTDGGNKEPLLSPIRADITDEEKFNIVSIAFGVPAEDMQELTRSAGHNPNLQSPSVNGMRGVGRGRGMDSGSFLHHGANPWV